MFRCKGVVKICNFNQHYNCTSILQFMLKMWRIERHFDCAYLLRIVCSNLMSGRTLFEFLKSSDNDGKRQYMESSRHYMAQLTLAVIGAYQQQCRQWWTNRKHPNYWRSTWDRKHCCPQRCCQHRGSNGHWRSEQRWSWSWRWRCRQNNYVPAWRVLMSCILLATICVVLTRVLKLLVI